MVLGPNHIFRSRTVLDEEHLALSVLAWARHVEFQALAIEDLVVVESRTRIVESDVFAREDLVVSSSSFRCPLSSRVLEIIHNFIFRSDELSTLESLSVVFLMTHNFCRLVPSGLVCDNNTNLLVVLLESISI